MGNFTEKEKLQLPKGRLARFGIGTDSPTAQTTIRSFFRGLTDIVYPKECVSCKNKITNYAVDDLVCFDCWTSIKENTPPFCIRCGRHLDKKNLTKNVCPDCIRREYHFDRAFSPCTFEGPVKELIHEFKYNGKDYLAKPLSRLLINFIGEYRVPVEFMDLIVPIPLHEARLRERQFNQATELSQYIAEAFNKCLADDILLRNRSTKTQADLKTADRLVNVQGSFSVQENTVIGGKNILLIDDVLTTGATASEASCALKKAGANIVFVLTLAN
ncbi:MAG TPA: ComF family protein [Candidatus Omnitrophota bacterium]|nr:ComF family protein [Candidatus Omnitrophota bacterium]HPT07337.1 ComF family protein [Candidatus Omnitrophota bacterium]